MTCTIKLYESRRRALVFGGMMPVGGLASALLS